MNDKETLLIAYKPLGWTPLAVIQAVKAKNPAWQHVPIGFAGRLDPMAEGLLLLLIGDANKKRKDYERLSKTYVCDVLFGITTDTYDLLGKVTSITENTDKNDLLQRIATYISHFRGKREQAYPPYSSPRIQGKSLFYWARNNRLSEITIPKKEIEVYGIMQKNSSVISAKKVVAIAKGKIALVQGDFRQEESIQLWEQVGTSHQKTSFLVVQFLIDCSSGTYIRSLAYELGQEIGCGALVYSLKRTRIGDFTKADVLL